MPPRSTDKKTQAPRSIVNGACEIAPVGQASTHAEQPAGHFAGSSFGLPRNLAGTEAAATSGITGWPSSMRTFKALGSCNFMNSSFGLSQDSYKRLRVVINGHLQGFFKLNKAARILRRGIEMTPASVALRPCFH